MLRSLTVLTLSVFAVTANAEDLTITFQSSDGETNVHYFSKDRMRHNSGRTDTIMDFVSGKITNIDHQKKEYSEMTVAEIDAAMKGVAAQMEEAMAQVPAAMRERMAKMMGGAGGGEVTVTKGGTRTIAGYSCQMYTVAMGSNMTQESCNTTDITPPFDPANFQKLTRVTLPMVQGMDKLVEKMAEVKGLSLMNHTSVNMMGKKIDTSVEATEVKKGTLGADVFALPTGYKMVDSPLKALSKGRR